MRIVPAAVHDCGGRLVGQHPALLGGILQGGLLLNGQSVHICSHRHHWAFSVVHHCHHAGVSAAKVLNIEVAQDRL